jgi:hypothetical protein
VRQIWVGGILLSTALSSSAITLGPQSGAGVLGRPLDIRVQAILAPGEEATDLCVSADVLYGDTQLSPGNVRTTLQRATPNAQAHVRVQASVAIDEPVVTVLLRAGCAAPFTRRYVLLADPISEPAATSPTATASGVSAAPRGLGISQLPVVSAPGASAPPSSNLRAANSGSAVPGAAQSAQAAEQQPGRASAKVPATMSANRASSVVRKPAAVQPAPAATPRLQLDAIDLSLAIERDPVLKLSLSLLSEPAGSEETRAAAGLLWKAVNASPEDILRDNTQLLALSAELSALRVAQTSSQTTVSELTSRLQESRQWQWLVVALGVLLALALVAMLWLWRQLRTRPDPADNQEWWAQAKALNLHVGNLAQDRSAAESSPLVIRDRTPVPDPSLLKPRPLSLSAELSAGRPGGFEAGKPVPLAVDRAEFAPSQSASRSVATEELFDVQQQADFFISLGEDEQAIKLLRDHIAESQVPSALTYLDLLKIYHRLGRQEPYEQLRLEFNGLFNAGVPVFDQFSDEGRGLEFYERALGRIQALWPEPRVLDVIEQSILREAGDSDSEVFDLEAYRELLLLYAMAKDMIQREAIDSKFPREFENTNVHALKATARRSAAALTNSPTGASALPVDHRPRFSPNLGLDVNLDDLLAPSVFEVSLPHVDFSMGPTADAVRPPEGRGQPSNMIDFELLDFTPPDDGALPTEQTGKKR